MNDAFRHPFAHLPSFRIVALTAAAMLAFAANSIFCRLALVEASIDPASFTFIRIGSGALVLWLVLHGSGRNRAARGSWRGAFALFGYMAAFSFAYVSLSAGAGALLLFGAVQATMVITGLVRGERLAALQWIGFVLALMGLAALVAPGISAPPFFSAVLMLAAGVSWGTYSLIGKGAADPLSATAGNFLGALVVASLLVVLATPPGLEIDLPGFIYAVLSGAIASGFGYTIWYAALRYLSPAQAASVQLSVPVITALSGTLMLGESITYRLVLCLLAILAGIALVTAGQGYRVRIRSLPSLRPS
jgi:drug/metabolite transporter (DMT)-like permease